jgi:hypothetical protein
MSLGGVFGGVFGLLGLIVASFIPPEQSTPGGILLVGRLPFLPIPCSPREVAESSSSSKSAKDGEMFDTTKHFCRSPRHCVRESHVVSQSSTPLN